MLREQEARPAACPVCGKGKLRVREEKPDPIYGALEVVRRTLKCDPPECGRLNVIYIV
jgi:hypothetical protein